MPSFLQSWQEVNLERYLFPLVFVISVLAPESQKSMGQFPVGSAFTSVASSSPLIRRDQKAIPFLSSGCWVPGTRSLTFLFLFILVVDGTEKGRTGS